MQQQTLNQYLTHLKRQFKATLAEPTWLVAEVSEFKEHKNGAYISLVEQKNGTESAKCNAVCWVDTLPRLQTKFKNATEMDIQKNMKVLICVFPTLSERFGLQLVITDIDPQYSLGDMEAKTRKIRAQLIKNNEFDKNKSHPTPDFYSRVAVITPQSAAGGEDFKKDADILQQNGITEFHYFHATFQGKYAAESVADAIVAANKAHKKTPFDAIFIIRGGGASADLYWLNDVKVVRYVCHSLVPCYTGIGHERDICLLDEVAKMNCGTPSKAIYLLINHLKDWYARTSRQYDEQVQRSSDTIESFLGQHHQKTRFIGYSGATVLRQELNKNQNALATQHQRAMNLIHGVMPRFSPIFRQSANVSTRLLENYQANMHTQVRNAVIGARRTLVKQVNEHQQSLVKTSESAIQLLQQSTKHHQQRVDAQAKNTQNKIIMYKSAVEQANRYIGTFSPTHTMRMGYALIEQDEQLIRSAEGLAMGKTTITFHDKTIDVNIHPLTPTE
jgi:exodeoxyribonuclease VII large subunit